MVKSDFEIERKYKDKASAYASGFLNGGLFGISICGISLSIIIFIMFLY